MASEKFQYFYDANGTKLRKYYYEDSRLMETTDYSGMFIYKDYHLDHILTSEGRLKWDDHDSLFHPEYFIKDHLGNVRVVLTTNPNFTNPTIQVTDYYPFGLEFKDVSISDNRNLYNSKELQTDAKLWWYDYGFRFYDPAIGRWNVPDPVAEWAYDWTPYRYAFNNPINYFDPYGLFETRKEAKNYRKENNIKGRIRKGTDEVYSIDNRKAGTSIWKDSEYGVVKGALVIADQVEGKVSNLPSDVNFIYAPLSSIERGAIDNNVPAIIMHRTVSSNGANLYSAWKAKTKAAGTHFLVGEDGTVYQTGRLTKHTIHLWSGSSKQMYKKYFNKILNSNTIGIEVIGNYDASTKTWDPLTPEQVTAVAHLVLELTFRYDLEMNNVLPHENVQRKTTGEGQIVLDAIMEAIQENW